MELHDQAIRERFIREHDRNFSVIAPAGVGKTTAITRRIADIVANRSIPLEKLIVVTYTNKAADELRQRTLLEVQKRSGNLNFYNKIFFGTIHAFADQLLRKYGHFIAIDPDFEIEKNENLLWNDFLQNTKDKSFIPPIIARFVPREALYVLVMNHYYREITNITNNQQVFSPIYLEPLLEFSAKSNANITRFQQNLHHWLRNPELPFPKINTTSKEFVALYEYLLRSAEDECSQICAYYFNDLAQRFEQFRLHERRFTFHDLIKFSINLLNDEATKNLLCNFFVILDEAQDTDPQQFKLLLGIARPSMVVNTDFFYNPPLPGHFCMVGDPQQSIYADRADVMFYQKIHKTFIENGTFEALHFSTTMRFGENIAHRVNQVFTHILNGKDGQVSFSPITSALENSSPEENMNTLSSHTHDWIRLNIAPFEDELSFLCHFFCKKNPQDFNISSWSEMAILCPRKNWLHEIRDAFSQTMDMPKLQIHSTTQTYGEFPEFSWPHALLTVLLDPQNQFEFSGILREIFGITDATIAHHFHSNAVPEIATIEDFFTTIRQKCITLSPLQIVNLLFQEFDLFVKITTIQRNFHSEIQKELQLLAAESVCSADFLCRLQQKSQEIYQSERIDQNAIQLYTFHKAKGLEWPIVVIPFINRKQTPAPQTFPDIVAGKIVINKRQYEEWSDPYAHKNNAERLLYVALTRQKQQTILIDDGREMDTNSIAAIFDKGYSASQGRCLRATRP
ncbi:MAG: UvrD-helicase domain-containing protein [Puniceicoccales bacterium]|jgi:ATP-dependent exoDNAse (exonuclease V) beta subunit|nr:UvrD-helicase domain-containing protein [Puniceicoccales bacterium]